MNTREEANQLRVEEVRQKIKAAEKQINEIISQLRVETYLGIDMKILEYDDCTVAGVRLQARV